MAQKGIAEKCKRGQLLESGNNRPHKLVKLKSGKRATEGVGERGESWASHKSTEYPALIDF